ncbi:MAG TPA: hypothetical protein VE093_28355 [Polyangiaceae bacterium]|nr:hypothetical protein [Polyangiaceae bacterium]
MRWTFQSVAAGLIFLAPMTVLAQQVDRAEEAKQLFLRGRDAAKRNDCQSAVGLFQESHRLSPRPGTLLNWAECEEKLGMIADAWQHFQGLLVQLPPTDTRLTLVREGISRLAPRVPKLQISVSPNAPVGLTVTLDGKAIEASRQKTELPVNPGKHVVEVAAPGRPKRAYEVNLAEGTSEAVVLEAANAPTPAPTSEPAPPETPPASAPQPELEPKPSSSPPAVVAGPRRETAADRLSPSRDLRIATFVVGGVGIAGLGLGSVMGALAIAKKNEIESLCPVPKQCTEEGVALESSARTIAGVSTGAFVVGLAGAGAAAVLLVLGRGGDAKPQVTSFLSPTGVGLRGTY